MGVKLIGFEKLEAKLAKNMDLSAVKTRIWYEIHDGKATYTSSI